MEEKIFENIVNNYYPTNTYEFDNSYQTSDEFKRYTKKINDKSLIGLFDELIVGINKEITPHKAELFGEFLNLPSRNIQIMLDNNLVNTLSIYFSYLSPYFHIVKLSGNTKNGAILSSYNFENDSELLYKIKSVIHEKSNYKEFPNSLINKKLPLIKLNSNFTYLNAFFTDYYRIKDF